LTASYLKQTRSGLYFRIRVPAGLACVIQRRELLVRLQARSRRAARLRAASLAVRATALFQELQHGMTDNIGESEVRSAVDAWLANEWDEVEDKHFSRERPYEWDEHDHELHQIDDFQALVREALGLGDLTGARWAVDSIFESLSLPVDRKSALYRRACRAYLEGWLRIYDRQRALLLGRPEEIERTSAAQTARVAAPVPTARGPLVSSLIEPHVQDKLGSGKVNQWTARDKVDKTLREFVEVVGDLPVNTVEYAHVTLFRDRLRRLPTKRQARPEYRGKSVHELLDLDIPTDIRISNSHIEQHLGRLSTFFDWCIRNKSRTLVTENPVKGVELKVQKSDRAPLNVEDLTKLFNSGYYRNSGPRACYVWWLPLLGIFTGARISELVLVRCDDIEDRDGVPLIRIRGGKTDNAKRYIAVHSKLVELGFLRYVEAVRVAGHQRVLFDAPIGKRSAGKRASEMVNRLLDAAGIADRDKVFHSARHAANQGMVEGGQPVMLIQATMGHAREKVGMTARYFRGADVKPAVLQQTIEAIHYDVDLSHLVDAWTRLLPSAEFAPAWRANQVAAAD
jgi:integrase